MKRISLAAAASFLALTMVAPGQAQQPSKANKEDISFRTVDGVLLKGAFYPSSKGANSPVVMFLHKLGSNSSTGDWNGLAARLQAKGFAVLSFDFRGHGKSTTIIEPKTFWSYPPNQVYVKGYAAGSTNPKKVINFTDIRSNGYIPYLLNDIAAARHDLDNRNDNGQCNTSNIILIGAEEGASLGMMWICTEFYRPAVYQNGLAGFGGGPVNNNPAGEDIAGAVWLSLRRNPGLTASSSITFPYFQAVSNTPAVRDIQMWFAAGDKDARGKEDALYMYDKILNAEKKKDQLPLTSHKTIDGTSLRGVNLIGKKELPTDELVEKFLDGAIKIRPNQSQKKRNASEFKPLYIDPTHFGFR